MAPTPQPQDYQIAIICALGIESNAVQDIFEELYDPKDIAWQKAPDDRNAYTLGRIGRHHVVLAHMSGMGKVTASITARDVRATFPNISRGLAFVVGVCGGAPKTPKGTDIFLGDIIIATEIQQADFGREHPYGFVMKEHSEGNLGPAPLEIKAFLHKASSHKDRSDLLKKTACFASELSSKLDLEPPDLHTDKLFPADYLHKHQDLAQQQCQVCAKDDTSVCLVSQSATCTQLSCSAANTRLRKLERIAQQPVIHFGPICSTDTIKRAGTSRDSYIKQYKALGFEMEGAGVWNTLPTIVVKAVCDYADSHKNKKWQGIAAINAAACCKALIGEWISPALGPMLQPAKVTQLEEQSIVCKKYLASLGFAQLDSRLHDIKFPQRGTCDWIFESSEFRSWLDPRAVNKHHSVLWIKGKPGSGKSVLMKHIYQADRFFVGHTVVGYFFHARGTELQQTLNGMLRGMLCKLLSSNLQLLNRFVAEFPTWISQKVEDRVWANSELQDFLFRSVRNSWLSNTVLMIDALDECDHADARELVSFCEDLALEAMHSKTRILICLSIRHFPNITMRKCQQLIIDTRTEHDADIRKYTARKLLVQELVPQVLQKAQHIFLWVVLVVQILNAYHDRGSDLPTMHAILSKIPAGLQAVFDLLLQNNTESDMETVFMLQLVLHSSMPFSSRSMYTTVIASTRSDWEDYVANNSMSNEALRLFIVSGSRGLLELSDTPVWDTNAPAYKLFAQPKPNLHVVQFIHESVADYLRDSRQVIQLEQSPVSQSAETCHAAIARAYLKIMNSGISERILKGKAPLSASSSPGMKAIVEAYHYATRNVLNHITEVSNLVELNHLLENYLRWFSLNTKFPVDELLATIVDHRSNLLQNARNENQMIESKFGARLETILRVVIQNDHAGLYDDIKASHIRTRYSHALNMAFGCRWREAVEALIEGGAQTPANDYSVLLLIDGAFTKIADLRTVDLPQSFTDTVEAEEQMLLLLLGAIPFGDSCLNLSIRHITVPIVGASRIGNVEMVRCLLEAGADPNTIDATDCNCALSAAINAGNIDVVRLLISYGVPNKTWPKGCRRGYSSPYEMAVQRGHLDIAKVLLEHSNPRGSVEISSSSSNGNDTG